MSPILVLQSWICLVFVLVNVICNWNCWHCIRSRWDISLGLTMRNFSSFNGLTSSVLPVKLFCECNRTPLTTSQCWFMYVMGPMPFKPRSTKFHVTIWCHLETNVLLQSPCSAKLLLYMLWTVYYEGFSTTGLSHGLDLLNCIQVLYKDDAVQRPCNSGCHQGPVSI